MSFDRLVLRFYGSWQAADPSFPPPIFLTTRPDLGDVSQGKWVTTANYYDLFNGIINPKQLEGLRLLVTPFSQQQFNATEDSRSEKPSLGVACFDCHVNGHTNAATHLVGDIRPQELCHRIDTPSLRGVNVQRLFGSQRALKTTVRHFGHSTAIIRISKPHPISRTNAGYALGVRILVRRTGTSTSLTSKPMPVMTRN
ncbi:protein of unknown function [Methylocaldum szegediense]|uniref:Cytochrome c domain-containing protein n=2 Tax=Methylocaldum szegediense TaxID=73780 RepID=A0ABM9HVY9_9GAMM|nr:protein of unknown function [Methylocaldum szegediense]